MLFTLLYAHLYCSQIPQLPIIARQTSKKDFTSYRDMIMYQHEQDEAYNLIDSIAKQNHRLLKNITKISNNHFNLHNQKTYSWIEERTFSTSILLASKSWAKKREHRLHRLEELRNVLENLQNDTRQLLFLNTLCIYQIPTPRLFKKNK